MSRRFTLQRPPAFNKFVTFPSESTTQFQTLRTRQSKCSIDSQKILQVQMLQQLFPISQNVKYSTLSSVLSMPKYSHRPVSIISIWCEQEKWLQTFLQQVAYEYNGWLQSQYHPHFNIFSDQLAQHFIVQQQFKQLNKSDTKLLLEYSISNMIILILRDNDESAHNKILELCEKISDTIFRDKSLDSMKPYLVLCKVTDRPYRQSIYQQKWRSFENKLNSWRHFRAIEILQIHKNQFQPQVMLFQDKIIHFQSTRNVKQIIRKQGKPQQVLHQIFTGKIMSSIIKNTLYSLLHNCYTNILNIVQNVIEQQREIFEREYSFEFNRLLDQKICSNANSLQRYFLFKCVLDCRKESARLFNSFGVNGRYKIAKIIEQRQLKFAYTEIQYKRQQKNRFLFEGFQHKYLSSRPVSFSNCKKILNELTRNYINDGEIEDLKHFMMDLLENYADELAWGDELNAFNIKTNRIDQIIRNLAVDITMIEKKIWNIQNKQFVRLLQYKQKQQIAKKIRRRKSKNRTSLQLLLTEKINRQQQKIQDFSVLVKELTKLSTLRNQVNNRQKQYLQKLLQIETLNKELQQIQLEQSKEKSKQLSQLSQKGSNKLKRKLTIQAQNKQSSRQQVTVAEQEEESSQYQEYTNTQNIISQEQLEASKIKEQEKQKIERQAKQKQIKKKKKKGFFACFGC